MARRKIIATVIDMRGCLHHQRSGLGYLAWHEDAERRMDRGEKQVRCPDCHLWLWPHEMGSRP